MPPHRSGELLKDKDGNIVVSRLDEKTLREIAQAGGGAYTLEEIGYMMDMTRERVRQVKDKALKKLRTRSKKSLQRVLNDD